MNRFVVAAAVFLSSTSAFAVSPFALPWMNHEVRDTQYRTADHADGVFVLEFAANYCGACNENAPNVDALAADYADEARVQVVDMMTDQNDAEIRRWIARHQPNHPVLKDVDKRVWNQINAQYIPTVVVTDCQGEIKYEYTGVWGPTQKAKIRQTVDGLLAESCWAN